MSIGIGVGINFKRRWVLSDEYLAVKAAMASTPSESDQRIQNDWVTGLIALGVWDKAIVLDNFAAHDAAASLFNWKTPASYNPTIYHSAVFTAYKGYIGNSAGAKLIFTNFVPSTNGTGFLGQDDMCVIIGQNDEVTENFRDFGSQTSAYTTLSAKRTGNLFEVGLNSATYVQRGMSVYSKRYMAMSRLNATQVDTYLDCVKSTIALNSSALSSDFQQGSGYGGAGNNKTTSFILIFKGLTESEVKGVIKICDKYLKHYGTNIRAYQTAIDFNVSLEGHSFFAFANVAPKVYLDYFLGQINAFTNFNSAVSGAVIADCVTRSATLDTHLITETSTYKNILPLWIGYNDVNNTAGTGLSTYNVVKSYVQARAAAGWKVFAYTMTPSQENSRDARFEAERVIFNDLFRTDLSLISGVYIMDTDTVAELTDCTNLTYFNADKLHLTVAGGEKASALFISKMVELYGS